MCHSFEDKIHNFLLVGKIFLKCNIISLFVTHNFDIFVKLGSLRLSAAFGSLGPNKMGFK